LEIWEVVIILSPISSVCGVGQGSLKIARRTLVWGGYDG